jgi:hypothetical protein
MLTDSRRGPNNFFINEAHFLVKKAVPYQSCRRLLAVLTQRGGPFHPSRYRLRTKMVFAAILKDFNSRPC